jgi:predicted amidohydrolase YtcJ
MRGLIDAGKLRSRVNMMTGPETRLEFRAAGMVTGAGDDRLRLGAVKFLLGESDGKVEPPQQELNRMALECHRDGFQLAFHAVTENQVEGAVKALEHIESQAGIAGRRHRIEHCGECPPDLLERLRKLGAIIVTQPPFIYYSGERYLATVAKSQLPWLYRIKAPLESGVVVAGSSDMPVVPGNPLVGICAAMTRKAESGQTLLPQESITPRQALALYTTKAAHASFEEEIKGSISPGKLADIVVLGDDPTALPPEDIKDIGVVMTIIGGEVVFES